MPAAWHQSTLAGGGSGSGRGGTSAAVKTTRDRGLSSRPHRRCLSLTPSCNLFPPHFLRPARHGNVSKRGRKQQLGGFKRDIYLPVRGGSVNVRTKRREKRTKLLLSALGNIYPPFIVTPLSRNVKQRPRILLLLLHRRRRPLRSYNVKRFTQFKPIFCLYIQNNR